MYRFRLWEAGHRFEEPRQYIIGLTGAMGEETEEELEGVIGAGMDFAISKLAPATELMECVKSVSLDIDRLERYQETALRDTQGFGKGVGSVGQDQSAAM